MFHHINQNKCQLSSLEIAEKEITNRYQRQNFDPSYPRHISNVSIRSHRGGKQMSHSYSFLPKTCQINKSDRSVEKDTNFALEILQYQLNDKKAKQTHLNNVKRSLERRMEAAKISGNSHLMALLRQELQQLEMNV